MGLSFHDSPSSAEAEAVSSLRFAAEGVKSMRSISQDGNLRIGLDNPNPDPDIIDIWKGRRDDDDIGGSDEIQMVYR